MIVRMTPHTHAGVCNGVIVAPPFAAFLQRWTAQYMFFQDSLMGQHSSYIPMVLAQQHPREVVCASVLVCVCSMREWERGG